MKETKNSVIVTGVKLWHAHYPVLFQSISITEIITLFFCQYGY